MYALIVSALVLQGSVIVHYGGEYAKYYPTVVQDASALTPDLPLEKAVVVASEHKNRTATLLRTSGSKVPYEKSVGVVTIESRDQPKRLLLLKGFRNVELKWIDDRHLFLRVDIGHIAGVDAIFDAFVGSWRYRQSLAYEVEPEK